MTSTLSQLLPVFVGVAIGQILQRTGALKRGDGDMLFRIFFYVVAPALAFHALSTVKLTKSFALFPFAAAAMVFCGYVIGRFSTKHIAKSAQQRGVVLIACMIVNSAFTLPFVNALHGAEGVARVIAFDSVNSFLIFGWAYAVAAKHNPNHQGEPVLVRRALASPPLYALVLGLVVNLTGWSVPAPIAATVSTFAATATPLLAIALGLLYSPTQHGIMAAAATYGLRLASGILIAIGTVLAFHLKGADQTVLLLLGVAPVGFNVVTFASLERLDSRLAADVLSLSFVASFAWSVAVALFAV